MNFCNNLQTINLFKRLRLFEVTKLRIWKQLTTLVNGLAISIKLFEVTKLRIWKQLTTLLHWEPLRVRLFEVTKLRIWKQLTTSLPGTLTMIIVVWGHKVTNLKATHNLVFSFFTSDFCCLRSQSYEFESNSQPSQGLGNKHKVVWGHKVTNLKATHNVPLGQATRYLVVCGHKVTNLKATHNHIAKCMDKDELFEVTKLRIWKQLTTISAKASFKNMLFEVTKLRIWKQLTTTFQWKSQTNCVVWGHKVTNLKATHNRSIFLLK